MNKNNILKITIIICILSIFIFGTIQLMYFLNVLPSDKEQNLEFNGKNTYLVSKNVNLSNQTGKQGLTVSIWVMIYPQENKTQNPIISKQGFQFYLDGEGSNDSAFTWIIWNNHGNGTYIISPIKYSYFTWYNVAATYDSVGGGAYLYVNGEMVNEGKASVNINYNENNWIIGKNDNDYFFKGRIKDLQLYSSLLDSKTIKDNYLNGSIIPTNLIGNWSLEEINFQRDFQINGEYNYIESNYIRYPFNLLSSISFYLLISSLLILVTYFIIYKMKLSSLSKIHSMYFLGILIKTFLAIMFPLSQDYLNILHSSSFKDIPIGISPQEGGFWFIIVHFFESIWNYLPISHPNINALFEYPFDMYYSKVPSPPGSYIIPLFFNKGADGLFLWTFCGRIPYILLDIACSFIIFYIIMMTCKDANKAIFGSFLWLFNPISCLLIEMWTSNDIVTVFFLLLTIYFILNNKLIYSSIFYSLSISVRYITIIFFPLFIYIYITNYKKNDLIFNFNNKKYNINNYFYGMFFSLLIFLVLIMVNFPILLINNLPLISNPNKIPSSLLLTNSSFFFFGIIFRSTLMNLYGFSYGITIILLIIYLLFSTRIIKKNILNITDIILVMYLLLFAFTNWNPQYWIWIIPFIIIKITLNKKYKNDFKLLFAIFLLINMTIIGYYYSTWGQSVLFFPNYNSHLKFISLFMYSLFNSPIITGLGIDTLLVSIFTGVLLYIIFNLLYDQYNIMK